MASGTQACLLLWPSVDWNFRNSSCSGADPEALLAGHVDDQPWQVLSWLPGSQSGSLQLAMTDGRRGRFRFKLAPDGVQILGITDVQLQGIDAQEASP